MQVGTAELQPYEHFILSFSTTDEVVTALAIDSEDLHQMLRMRTVEILHADPKQSRAYVRTSLRNLARTIIRKASQILDRDVRSIGTVASDVLQELLGQQPPDNPETQVIRRERFVKLRDWFRARAWKSEDIAIISNLADGSSWRGAHTSHKTVRRFRRRIRSLIDPPRRDHAYC